MIVREPSRVSRVIAAVGDLLDVQIVLAHVGHPPAVGRELGEHERGRRRGRAAELPERSRWPRSSVQ